MRVVLNLLVATAAAAAASTAAACRSDDSSASDSDSGQGTPAVVVTSTILGDIVAELVGDDAEVQVLLPIGADPHDFSPSTRQAEAMADADLLVLNGGGFEGGLADTIDRSADAGTPLFTAVDHADLLEGDPHIWTDPSRMVPVIAALTDALVAAGVDEAATRQRSEAYATELEAVDAELEDLLATVPEQRRVLVTNHEVLAYFADRYGFEVIGTVIPSVTTGAAPSTAAIEALAELIDAEGVPAIFGETSSPSQLARALADLAGGDVAVVELFTESLGEEGSGAETYLGLLRTDAQRIHDALAP